MNNCTYENEAIKKKYFSYVKDGEGLADNSIYSYARCIKQWQVFTKDDSFSHFNTELAGQFKDYLKVIAEEKGTSLRNQHTILRHLKKFFNWLCEQKGYEKIKRGDVNYLRLSKKDARAALEKNEKEILKTHAVRALIASVKGNTEVDMRDRALICLFALTGMRVSAISSLPIRSFNRDALVFRQSPNIGVKTKNSKTILTTFVPIDISDADTHFLAWFDYLVKEKNFLPTDPIFPSTYNSANNKISNVFWKSSNPAYEVIRKRLKDANLPHYSPHAFRHFASAYLSEMKLTEKEKKACSVNFGHENVSTTFGAYGYGNMSSSTAIETVKDTRADLKNTSQISEEQKLAINRLLASM